MDSMVQFLKEEIERLYTGYKQGYEYMGKILEIDEKTWKTPLKDFVYLGAGGKKHFRTKEEQEIPIAINLAYMVTTYDQKNPLLLREKTTLEEAVKQVLGSN